MFNLTGSEIVVILLLALVILGPEKLPDAIRRFGRTYAEFKRMSAGFQTEFRSVLEEPVREMRDTADMLGRATSFEPAKLEEPTPTESSPGNDTATTGDAASPGDTAATDAGGGTSGPAPATGPEPGPTTEPPAPDRDVP